MMGRVLALLALVGVVAAAPPITDVPGNGEQAGCSKEQYREKFGALPTYELHTSPVRPSLNSGFVSAKVTYKSKCAGGGSSFSATIKKKEHMEIVLLSRSEPSCPEFLDAPVSHSEVVSVPLPADAGEEKKFLAFPPDGEYELWLLAESESDKGPSPEFMAESGSNQVEGEIAQEAKQRLSADAPAQVIA